MSNGDDPFRPEDEGDDWGTVAPPPEGDEHIDMNYGQPLSGAPPQPQQPLQQQPHQHQLQPTKQKFDNDDVIAMVVSLFLPGVGHMMLGQVPKGIVILLVSFFTCGGMGLLYICVLLDVYLVAMTRKYRTLGDWEILPNANQHLKT